MFSMLDIPQAAISHESLHESHLYYALHLSIKQSLVLLQIGVQKAFNLQLTYYYKNVE